MVDASDQRLSTRSERATNCRLCGADLGSTVFSLGDQPISNRLDRNRQDAVSAPRYPLALTVCPSCDLTQLSDNLDASEHFHDDYAYRSSLSQTWLDHCDAYSQAARTRYGLGDGDLVFEAGSNDGALLKAFSACGLTAVGIEPSANVAQFAIDDGIATEIHFLTSDTAAMMREKYGPAKAVFGNNVLAHVPDTDSFLKAAKSLLAPDGFLCFEFPYVLNIIDKLYFDTIYHEHYTYLGIAPLMQWADVNGMVISAIEPQSTHGGSLRVLFRFAAHAEEAQDAAAYKRREEAVTPARWVQLERDLSSWREQMRGLISERCSAGKQLAGYGGASKATVMLNFLQITSQEIAICGDASPLKQGRFIPGTGIEIVPPEQITSKSPDSVIVFAWNIFDELKSVLRSLIDRPTEIICPLPDLTISQIEPKKSDPGQ